MFGIVINELGFKVEFVALNEDGTIQSYELKENEQVITTDWNVANSRVKPKWNFTTLIWEESATQQEIIEWEANQPKPSTEPTLEERILQLEVAEVNRKSKEIEQQLLNY